jgi:hypothetical protein
VALFESWRTADEEWGDRNLELLVEVYQWFLTHEEWPEVGPLQHAMYKRTPRITNVREIANARPSIPGQFAPGIAQSIWLGARHLTKFSDARPLLNSTVKAARAAVEVFLDATPGEQMQVHQSNLGPTSPGDDSIRKLVPRFVFSDHPTPFAGGSFGDEWIMGINESLVMKFEGVSDPEEYVARQLGIIEGWCAELETRRGAVREGGPIRAFIVMPFEEEWSEVSREFIDHAISLVDSKIVADRADDIDDPGRITDQIVNRLEEADLVISDITGNNANVGWELGFGYARSKPCVITRRRDSASAPFDIYDQRRVDYSPEPTVAEAQRLKRMIESAIEQVRSSVVAENLSSVHKGPLFG